MRSTLKLVTVASLTVILGRCEVATEEERETVEGHHHHHHKKHHHGHHDSKASPSASVAAAAPKKEAVSKAEKETLSSEVKRLKAEVGATPAKALPVSAVVASSEKDAKHRSAAEEATVVSKVRALEGALAAKEFSKEGVASQRGTLKVNGPIPDDFSERFVQAASRAVACETAEIRVLESYPAKDGSVEVVFEAPVDVVHAIEDQAADPNSKLTNSPLHNFLVAHDGATDAAAALMGSPDVAPGQAPEVAMEAKDPRLQQVSFLSSSSNATAKASAGEANSITQPCDGQIDIDTDMPYGELEPFGREDTAQELTESSITESDEMVDQLERAEVAEEKRAVFRALTRLRGAAITSFDGVARSQTGNIDEYNKVHKWRMTHPLRHLADEESDISKWAFPDNADF